MRVRVSVQVVLVFGSACASRDSSKGLRRLPLCIRGALRSPHVGVRNVDAYVGSRETFMRARVPVENEDSDTCVDPEMRVLEFVGQG